MTIHGTIYGHLCRFYKHEFPQIVPRITMNKNIYEHSWHHLWTFMSILLTQIVVNRPVNNHE